MSEQQPVGATPSVRVVRGAPDEREVAARGAGRPAAAAAGVGAAAGAPGGAGGNRARVLRGTGDGATAKSFGGRAGRHNADSWRWSLRS